MTIYFYSNREVPYGCFSNFSAHGFELDNHWWPTSEHYFQAQKFVETDPEWASKIRQAKSPGLSARMGRDGATPLREEYRRHPLRTDWETIKDEIMHRAVLQKFTIHTDIRTILLATGDEYLVENAPRDFYWGCGKDGSGQNKLGQILVSVRTALQQGDRPIN